MGFSMGFSMGGSVWGSVWGSVPAVAKLGRCVDGQLWPLAAAGEVGVGPVRQQDLHAALVALLGRQHQGRGQVSGLGVDVRTYGNTEKHSVDTAVSSGENRFTRPLNNESRLIRSIDL